MKESQIKILDYQEAFKEDFFRINHEWVDDMFKVEEVDLLVLQNPEREIIAKGGGIWFAQHQELGVVGACALVKVSHGIYELTKMGVLKQARGLKVGECLLKHVIEKAKQIDGIQQLYILTNSICEAAVYLYLKNGFRHDAQVMACFGHKYQRCNVALSYPFL